MILFTSLNALDCRNTVVFYPEPNNPSQPLWTIDVGSTEYITNISFLNEAGSGWEYCEVHLNSSWCLGCDGSRLASSQYVNRMMELFALRESSTDVHPPRFALSVRNND